jgi:hypothetical protein
VKDVTASKKLDISTPLITGNLWIIWEGIRKIINGWITLLAKQIPIPAKEERNV